MTPVPGLEPWSVQTIDHDHCIAGSRPVWDSRLLAHVIHYVDKSSDLDADPAPLCGSEWGESPNFFKNAPAHSDYTVTLDAECLDCLVFLRNRLDEIIQRRE